MRHVVLLGDSIFDNAAYVHGGPDVVAQLPVLELRDIFTSPADYANPIEPSVHGGAKLAQAIIRELSGAR